MTRAAVARLFLPPALRLPAVIAAMVVAVLIWVEESGWPLVGWLTWWGAATAQFLRGAASAMPQTTLRPLPLAAETARRLRALLASCGAAATPVLLSVASGPRPMANAAVIGMGGGRRILLTDDLVAALSPAQTAGVVAHELGHACGRHHLKWLLGQGAAGLAFFAFCGVAGWPALSAAPLWSLLLRPLAAAWRRRWEHEADAFAADMGLGPDLAEALAILDTVNGRRAPPSPSSLWARWASFHPNTTERATRLRR